MNNAHNMHMNLRLLNAVVKMNEREGPKREQRFGVQVGIGGVRGRLITHETRRADAHQQYSLVLVMLWGRLRVGCERTQYAVSAEEQWQTQCAHRVHRREHVTREPEPRVQNERTCAEWLDYLHPAYFTIRIEYFPTVILVEYNTYYSYCTLLYWTVPSTPYKYAVLIDTIYRCYSLLEHVTNSNMLISERL